MLDELPRYYKKNMETRIMQEKTKTNWDVFYNTIKTLSGSQGFYSRLYNEIESWDEDTLQKKIEIINNAPIKFNEPVDVVLYLEG